MSEPLFQSGIRPRLLAALGFAVLVFGAISLVNRPGSTPKAEISDADAFAPAKAATPEFIRIDIESVQPVGEWLVRLGDTPLHPLAVSPTTWEAEVTVLPENRADLLSVLTTAEARATSGNALRVRVYSRDTARTLLEKTHWCGSADCVFELPLREVAP